MRFSQFRERLHLTCIQPTSACLVPFPLLILSAVLDDTRRERKLNPDATPAAEHVFLIESPHGWGGVWQRPHHIFRLLSERFTCYYVATRYLRDVWKNPAEYLRGRYLIPSANLTVREIVLLNGERLPFIRSYNIRHLAVQLRKFTRFHTAARKILWIYDPHQVGIVDRVAHDILVYDIMDEYTGFPWSPPDVAKEERKLLSRADLVIAGTYALYESKKPMVTHGKIDWILSAVDYDHFHTAAKTGDLPPDLAEIRSRFKFIGGYYGVCDMRLNTDLISCLAERLPEWAFVFIGPIVGEKIRNLINRKIPNVLFIGPRHYNLLPSFARGFDVCTIPFILDRLTLHINPTKVLEYFAAGKPVVSVPIPDVEKFYGDIVFLSKTADEFADSLEKTVSSSEVKRRIDKGIETARSATWQAAVDKIIHLLNLEE